MERAFTPPLMARMGDGSAPDPHNITAPAMTSFNMGSWDSAVRALSAHPLGGLRFSSFRYPQYQKRKEKEKERLHLTALFNRKARLCIGLPCQDVMACTVKVSQLGQPSSVLHYCFLCGDAAVAPGLCMRLRLSVDVEALRPSHHIEASDCSFANKPAKL